MKFERDLVQKLKEKIDRDEILLIIGPRQAGKTTVMKQTMGFLKAHGKKCYSINLEDPQYLSLLNQSPKNLFKIIPIDKDEKSFLFIDEIQYLENPSNFLKYFYDEYKGKIKITASGSSSFYMDKKFKDSLAGRKILFNLFPLSFKEFLRFKKERGLSESDFRNLTISEKDAIIPYYIEYLTYGGFPKVVLSPVEEKVEILRDLAFSYIKKDMFEAGVRHEESFFKLLKIFASQIGGLVNIFELATTLGISKTAVENYLYIMKKSFHISLISPFYKNPRKELTKMPKVYFIDTGLRNFFRNNFKPIINREDRGDLFENAVFRQLMENNYVDEIKFWRTTNQKEVDFIVNETHAYEVKYQIKSVKSSSYKYFLEHYPEIKFRFVVFEESVVDNFEVIYPWELKLEEEPFGY